MRPLCRLPRRVGEANYDSRGASGNLEIDVKSGLVRELGKLQAKIDCPANNETLTTHL